MQAVPETADKNDIQANATELPVADRSPASLDEHKLSDAGTAAAAATGEPVSHRPCGRFFVGIGVGGVVALPLSWLLAHAATLPFFIGVFFFALFGLLIGAVVHRVAAPGRPYTHRVVMTGTVALIAGGWLVSIIVEAQALPMDLARNVPDWTLSLGGLTRSEFVANVAGRIRSHLDERYPPGGTIGYMRWVMTSGVLPKGSITDVRRTLRLPQRKGWWLLRVVLSIGLFSFGISTQTLLLRLRFDPAAVRASDARNH